MSTGNAGAGGGGESSAKLAAALGRPPPRHALQQHTAHALALGSTLTLPPARTLAALVSAAENRTRRATEEQHAAKQRLFALLDDAAGEDRALTAALGSLPDQIDTCDEAILSLTSPTAAALEDSLQSHLRALTQIQRARDYFALLAAAEDLRIEAVGPDNDSGKSTKKDVRAGLPALAKLATLCTQSTELLPDERIKGLAFIRAQRDYAFHELRKRAIANLRSACEAAGWSPFSATAAAAAATAASQPDGQPVQAQIQQPVRRLDAHKDVQVAWKDLCRFQRTAERLGLMPPATAPLLRTDADEHALTTTSADSKHVAASSGTPAPRPGSPEYVPLLAVTVLLDILLLRFRYHFDSSRPSNRLDKPEWYLAHILGLVRSYGVDSDLFRPGTGSVARLCALGGFGRAHGVVPVRKGSAIVGADGEDVGSASPHRLLDTGAELLHGLLVPLRAKLVASMPLLLPHPPLLAHTISEYIRFDDALRSTYPAANLEAPHTGRGAALSLADQVLNNSDWFAAWLEGERAHAEERLDEILNAPDAWAIQAADGVEDEDDAVARRAGDEAEAGPPLQRFPTQAAGSTTHAATAASTSTAPVSYKTVRSAQQIVELLESVQERAAPLPLLTHRVAFFARIQLPLLRAYADRLGRSLDAFESLSGAFARAMPGAMEGVHSAVAGAGGVGGHGMGGGGAAAAAAAGVVLSGGGGSGGGGGGGGGHDADMVRGLRGLGRLLKAHLSAAHLVDTLSHWNDTPFFLALAAELRETDEGRKLAVELRVAEGEAEQEELDKASLVSLLRRSLRRQTDAGGGGGGGTGSGTSTGGHLTPARGRPAAAAAVVETASNAASGVASLGIGTIRKAVSVARDRSSSRTRGTGGAADGSGGAANARLVGLGGVGDPDAAGAEGGVWDDILGKYRALLRRSTAAMERLIVHEIMDALKPYSYRRWDEGSIDASGNADDDDEDEDDDEDSPSVPRKSGAVATAPVEPIPTPSLLPALTLLSTHLGHLLPALPPKHALPVYRSIASTLSTAIVDRVVMSGGAHRFTYAGGQRFARDVETGWFGVLSDLMENFGGGGGGGGERAGGSASRLSPAARAEAAMDALGRRPRAPWRELEGAGTLLSLNATSSGSVDEGEDGVDGVDGLARARAKWSVENVTWALFEVDEADDRAGWVAVGRELRLEGGLTLVRAREVVRRRVECAK